MLITNNTNLDYYFGPLHLPAGIGATLTVDDSSATSLYLTDDGVADAINSLAVAPGPPISVSSITAGIVFPRPTGTPEILHGDGAPEGSVYSGQGSLYMARSAGSATNFLFTKTTGVHLNTGWVAINPAGGGGVPATTLPSMPTDGVQAVLVDSTSAPTYSWILQYSAAASGWLFIGGGPLSAADNTNTSRAMSGASYSSYTSAPSVTVPRAGIYKVQCNATIAPGTNNIDLSVSYAVGATAASDNDRIHLSHALSAGSVAVSGTSPISTKSGVAASAAISMQQKVTTGSGNILNSSISVWPVLLT